MCIYSNSKTFIAIFKLCLLIISFSYLSRATDMDRKVLYRNLSKIDFNEADAVKSDVIYKYFGSSSDSEGKILTEETVRDEKLNKCTPMVLLIHGFTSDDTTPWFKPIKDEIFKLGPYHVFYINWSKAGNKTYNVSSANIKPIGKYIAEFLISSGIPRTNIHLVGHSLGAQLAGFIGKSIYELTGEKIDRITGLDPAGPKFDYPPMKPHERLYPTDATFVDVLHTDIQFYGYTHPTGHVDYYVNGGGHQPGCVSYEEDGKRRDILKSDLGFHVTYNAN